MSVTTGLERGGTGGEGTSSLCRYKRALLSGTVRFSGQAIEGEVLVTVWVTVCEGPSVLLYPLSYRPLPFACLPLSTH